MAEMHIIKDTGKGKVAVIFKDDGTLENQRAFACESCHKYWPESMLITTWLGNDDAYLECEACRNANR